MASPLRSLQERHKRRKGGRAGALKGRGCCGCSISQKAGGTGSLKGRGAAAVVFHGRRRHYNGGREGKWDFDLYCGSIEIVLMDAHIPWPTTKAFPPGMVLVDVHIPWLTTTRISTSSIHRVSLVTARTSAARPAAIWSRFARSARCVQEQVSLTSLLPQLMTLLLPGFSRLCRKVWPSMHPVSYTHLTLPTIA